MANIGVHGAPATLHWSRSGSRTSPSPWGWWTCTTPTLLRLLADGQIDPTPIITHRFGLDEMMHAYDVFGRPNDTGALQVLLERTS